MKEDHVSNSKGDKPGPGDDNGVDPGHKRLDSASSLSSSSSDSSEEPLTESPAIQLMERKSDAGSDDNSHYRFPSSVFSRTKSNTGKEWSINSNESLFSIHMGTMSFNKDLYWIAKSGELGKNGEPLMSPRPPLPDLPPPPSGAERHGHQPPHALPDYTPQNPNNPPEGGKRNTKLDEGLCATPEAVETMKSILMENSGQRRKESVSVPEGSSSASLHRRSNESRDSTTSFAFPILTGHSNSSKKNKKSSQKLREDPGAVDNSKPQTPKAGPAATTGQAKWFGCFSCCSGGGTSSS